MIKLGYTVKKNLHGGNRNNFDCMFKRSIHIEELTTSVEYYNNLAYSLTFPVFYSYHF